MKLNRRQLFLGTAASAVVAVPVITEAAKTPKILEVEPQETIESQYRYAQVGPALLYDRQTGLYLSALRARREGWPGWDQIEPTKEGYRLWNFM